MNAVVEGIKNPDLSKFLVIGALLFVIGRGGCADAAQHHRHLYVIELILNAANLNFIAFSRYCRTPEA